MQNPYKIRLRPGDIILILILFSLSIAGFIFQKEIALGGRLYLIEMDGKTLYRLPLSSDTLITLETRTGSISIRTKSGRVCVSESSCPLKICVKTGWIKRPGEAIICVPNRMVVRIEGEKRKNVDAITE